MKEIAKKSEKEQLRIASGLMIMVGAVLLSIAVSLIMGAGMGVLVIAVFCILVSKVFYDAAQKKGAAEEEQSGKVVQMPTSNEPPPMPENLRNREVVESYLSGEPVVKGDVMYLTPKTEDGGQTVKIVKMPYVEGGVYFGSFNPEEAKEDRSVGSAEDKTSAPQPSSSSSSDDNRMDATSTVEIPGIAEAVFPPPLTDEEPPLKKTVKRKFYEDDRLR